VTTQESRRVCICRYQPGYCRRRYSLTLAARIRSYMTSSSALNRGLTFCGSCRIINYWTHKDTHHFTPGRWPASLENVLDRLSAVLRLTEKDIRTSQFKFHCSASRCCARHSRSIFATLHSLCQPNVYLLRRILITIWEIKSSRGTIAWNTARLHSYIRPFHHHNKDRLLRVVGFTEAGRFMKIDMERGDLHWGTDLCQRIFCVGVSCGLRVRCTGSQPS
jgi:hypothetical protein